MTDATPVDVSGGAMSGVRVLDFTRFLQGPYATRLFADMGADVIKVERPGGEWDRRLRVAPDGFAGFFTALNRGKRSVAIDLQTPEGKELALRLAATFDVVIDNFRPGVMDRLGLGYESIREVNPQIIYAAASGYGPDGPRSKEPMFDMVAQAVTGVSDFMRAKDGTPRLATRALSDSAGAMFLAMAVITALYVRERTGMGQRVDASLVGSTIGMHTAEITISLHEDKVFRPQGRVTSTSGAFLCGDGAWLVIGATDQKLWDGLSRALGLEHLSDDPRFSKSRVREQNRAELEPLLEAQFLTRPRSDWILLLQANDVPVAPVNTFLDLVNEEDVMDNGYIVEQEDRVWGPIKVVGHPFHMTQSPAHVRNWTPELGEHTRAELLGLGLTGDEIDSLIAAGIVEAAEGVQGAGP